MGRVEKQFNRWVRERGRGEGREIACHLPETGQSPASLQATTPMESPLLPLPHFLLLSVTHGKEYPPLANLGQWSWLCSLSQPGVQAQLCHSQKMGALSTPFWP